MPIERRSVLLDNDNGYLFLELHKVNIFKLDSNARILLAALTDALNAYEERRKTPSKGSDVPRS